MDDLILKNVREEWRAIR